MSRALKNILLLTLVFGMGGVVGMVVEKRWALFIMFIPFAVWLSLQAVYGIDED